MNPTYEGKKAFTLVDRVPHVGMPAILYGPDGEVRRGSVVAIDENGDGTVNLEVAFGEEASMK